MMNVKILIHRLEKFPPGSYAYAFEGLTDDGEKSGIVVVDRIKGKQIAFIEASEDHKEQL